MSDSRNDENSPHVQPTSSGPSQDFSILDAISEPIILLANNLSILHINTEAAACLRLPNRHVLPEDAALARTLAEFVRPVQLRHSRLRSASAVPHAQELSLLDGQGVKVSFVASVRPVPGFLQTAAAYTVTLHSTEGLKPIVSAIEQAQRARRTLIYLAARLKHSVVLERSEETTGASDNSPNPVSTATTDILPALTKVIGLLDLLVDDSITFRLDCRSPGLLAIPQSTFMRMFAHLLLEAADFAGAGGVIKLRTVLEGRRQGVLEMLIVAQRKTAGTFQPSHPMLNELARLTGMPRYQVTVEDEEPTMRQFTNGEDSYSALLGSGASTRLLGDNASLALDTLSENLRISAALAKHSQSELQLRRLRNGILSFYLQLNLTDERNLPARRSEDATPALCTDQTGKTGNDSDG